MDTIELAKNFATEKFSESGVENHFLDVYSLLQDTFEINNQNILVAGILHDVLEDTETTDEEISSNFGPEVLRLVLEVSHCKNWKDAKRTEMTKQDLMAEYYEHLKYISDEAKLIKIADFTSHLSDFIKIYQKNEQHQYPKFANNAQYVAQIQNFLDHCTNSPAKKDLSDLATKLKSLL